MMSSAQYGRIIKHLETSHLDALPIPLVRDDIAVDFHNRTQAILKLATRLRLALEAEVRLSRRSAAQDKGLGRNGFDVCSTLFAGRALEAHYITRRLSIRVTC